MQTRCICISCAHSGRQNSHYVDVNVPGILCTWFRSLARWTTKEQPCMSPRKCGNLPVVCTLSTSSQIRDNFAQVRLECAHVYRLPYPRLVRMIQEYAVVQQIVPYFECIYLWNIVHMWIVWKTITEGPRHNIGNLSQKACAKGKHCVQ